MNPIKPQDLRIGNSIYHLRTKERKVVTIVDWYDIELCSLDNNAFNEQHLPIPLTEEVLVKCGFEYDGVNRLWKEPIYLIQFPDGYLFLANQRHVNLYYLHQLQNLYWCICGEELIYKP